MTRVHRRTAALLFFVFTTAFQSAWAQIQITFPTTRAVFQRGTNNQATLSVGGQFSVPLDKVEARFVPRQAGQGNATGWTTIQTNPQGGVFLGTLAVQGGWYDLEVRGSLLGVEVGKATLERVGVGEVFIIAGQSNAQGLPDKNPPDSQDDRVNCVTNYFNEARTANDPPRTPEFGRITRDLRYATNGQTAWAWGALGDLLAQRLNVPILFLNAGFGASTVKNWRESADGQRTINIYCAECADEFKYFTNGIPYVNLKTALNYYASLLGVRAVLWHQGETDNLPLRTPGDEYRENLKYVIQKSREHSGKNLSWVVGRVSLAANQTSPTIINAQNEVIAQTANVFAGPNTDLVQVPRPDDTHFSGEGHRQHAQAWSDALTSAFFNNSQPQAPSNVLTPGISCAGGNRLQLGLTGFGSYAWTNNQNGDVSTQASLTGEPGRTYYPRAKDNKGNSVFGVPFIVPSSTTTGSPTITADGPTQLCGGTGSVTLTSSAALGNQWSNGATTRSITVSQAGNYTVQTRSVYGCLSDASASTNVSLFPGNPPARPTIAASGATSFCPGGSVTLTASGTAANFVWSNGASGKSITVNQAGNYTVRAVDANNCGSPASTAVAVTTQNRPETPVVTASGSTTLCQGGTLTLTANGNGTNFVWSNGATGKSITVTQEGSYSVRIQDGGTCQSDASNTVAVKVSPPLSAPAITSSTGGGVVCAGQTLTLTATDAASYVWSNGATTRNVTVKDAGSYTVRTKDANGCESPQSGSFDVKVNALPAPTTITPGGKTSFCPDSSVTLTAAAANVVWSNNFPTQSIVAAQPGTYTARVKDGNGCLSVPSNSINVSLLPTPAQPAITTSGPTTFCAGGNVTLRSPEALAYAWSNGSTSRELNLSTAGSFTLTVTGANGCRSPRSAPVNVVVNPLPAKPTLATDGSTTLCQGNTLTITASPEARYAWNTGSTDRSIRVTQSGRFAVRVTDGNGCVSPASDTLNVTVNPLPAQPRITTSGPTTFCADRNVTLTSTEERGYEWSTGATTRSVTLNQPGTYRVRTINQFNCPSPYSESITTVVNPLPAAPVVTAKGATTFCETDFVELCSNSPFRTTWSIGTDSTSCIRAQRSGAYTARVTNAQGCMSPVSNSILVDAKPLPNTPDITQVGTYTLEARGVITGDDYAWQRDGQNLPPRSQLIKATQAGSYTVQTRLRYPLGGGASLECLSKPSTAFVFTPDLSNAGLSLYPNPTSTGQVTLETLNDWTNVRVRIFTLHGHEVYTTTIPSFAERQRVAFSLPAGTYILTTEAAGFRATKRFIVY
jgi:hypothetical protein